MDSVEKKKKPGFFSRLFGRKKGSGKTVVRLEAVGDIPPILDVRKDLADGLVKNAVIEAFNAAKTDYIRQFGINLKKKSSNRQFLIEEFQHAGFEISEEASVNNDLLLEYAKRNIFDGISDHQRPNRLEALKKLTALYLNFYEKVRFADLQAVDTSNLLATLEAVYNHLDVMSLYYSMSGEQGEELE